MTTMILVMHI